MNIASVNIVNMHVHLWQCVCDRVYVSMCDGDYFLSVGVSVSDRKYVSALLAVCVEM